MRRGLQAKDSGDIDQAITEIGKGDVFASRPEVERILASDDGQLRSTALRGLALYWDVAFKMALSDRTGRRGWTRSSRGQAITIAPTTGK